MAVQAQLYPERLGLLPMRGLQDCMFNNPVPGLDSDQFGFVLQGPHHQQQNLFLQQQNFGFDCNLGTSSSSTTCDSSLSMALSQYLDAQLDMQRREVDYMLHLQAERLRSALQQQKKQQLGFILKSVESKVSCLMRQKEEDLAQATKKSMELEARLREVEMEREQWQKLAREKEAMVVDLSNTLEQVRERLVLANNKSEDAESFYYGSSCDREQEETQKKIVCKGCNSRNSCIIFLPCRHLCSCKPCEAFLGFCPICKSVKEASMEVLWV